MKREYRGQRSAEAFVSFIQKQLVDPIKEFKDLKELTETDVSNYFVVSDKWLTMLADNLIGW